MNSTKEWLMETWRFRAHLYFILNGIKNMIKLKSSILFSAVYWIIFVLLKSFVVKDIAENFWLDIFFITTYICYLIYKGKPKGAGRMMRDCVRIGLVNHVGETPIMIENETDNRGIYHITFRNFGIPISKWNDHKEDIEFGLNLNITDIKENGKKYIVITAVSGENILPDFVEWKDSCLPYKNFELALGETYTGQVTINIAISPHILLAGSTGSGKTILLKLLLMQALKKKAEVYIADFKGGVDFPRVWHNHDKCHFITEKEDLLNDLDEIVIELHRRKVLLADSDCANIDEYNSKYHRHLHRIIFACDELAEVTEKSGLDKKEKELVSMIEASLSTILRLGRAMGIHAVLCTQRPSRDVIPGVVVNNSDIKICGRADDVLSQIVLDKTDASDLISKSAQGRFLTNDDVLFQAYWFDDSRL